MKERNILIAILLVLFVFDRIQLSCYRVRMREMEKQVNVANSMYFDEGTDHLQYPIAR